MLDTWRKGFVRGMKLSAACYMLALILVLVLSSVRAHGQTIGGNASLSVTNTSSNVAIPVAAATYPAVLIAPPVGSSTEVFYKLGADNTVAATTSSPALPSGGICLNAGAAKYVAAITAAGTATLRITQLTQCPQNWAAVGQSSGGTVSVSPYSYTPLSPGQHNFTITSSTALTIPTGATYATLCASVATIKYTTDGTTTPTSSVGMPLSAGSCVGFSGATVLSNLRLISTTGTPDVEYFR